MSSHRCGPRAAADKSSFHWCQWKYEAVGNACRKQEGLGKFRKLQAFQELFLKITNCWMNCDDTCHKNHRKLGGKELTTCYLRWYFSRYLSNLFLNIQRQRPMCLSSAAPVLHCSHRPKTLLLFAWISLSVTSAHYFCPTDRSNGEKCISFFLDVLQIHPLFSRQNRSTSELPTQVVGLGPCSPSCCLLWTPSKRDAVTQTKPYQCWTD